jgi:hypothetical protein
MRIAIAKGAFNRKISLLTTKLNLEEIGEMLYLEHCFIWLRDLDTKRIQEEVFGEFWNGVLEENEEDKMSENVTNEQVIERIGEKRTLLKISYVEKPIIMVIFWK